MKNWERHQQRIANAKFALEFIDMVTDMSGDFMKYCCNQRKDGKCNSETYVNCLGCQMKWLKSEVEGDGQV